MSVRPQPGTVHMHPSGLVFLVLSREEFYGTAGSTAVKALVLHGRPDFPMAYQPGTLMHITRYSGYWDASRPFTSLEKEGKVSP